MRCRPRSAFRKTWWVKALTFTYGLASCAWRRGVRHGLDCSTAAHETCGRAGDRPSWRNHRGDAIAIPVPFLAVGGSPPQSSLSGGARRRSCLQKAEGERMNGWKRLQPAVEYAARSLDRNLTLSELAACTDRSESHAHRTLRAVLAETPKQFMLRLRVDRAAAALVSSRPSIVDIAFEYGFESHADFCRAFRRRLQMSPSVYRKQRFAAWRLEGTRHQ